MATSEDARCEADRSPATKIAQTMTRYGYEPAGGDTKGGCLGSC